MQQILKNIAQRSQEHLYFVGATLISAFVHFIYSIFVKANITPFEYGIYSTCTILSTYMGYAQLGALNAFNRDYPQLIGAKNFQRAKEYRDTTFSFMFVMFGLLTFLISFIVLFTISDKRYSFGLIMCAITTSASSFENFLASRVRIDGSFRYTSFVLIAELISVIAGFLLIPYIGYYALYLVTICSMMIGIVLYYKRGMSDITFYIDSKLLSSIILSGLPLLINSLIWTVVNSIDKFVILKFMNTEDLGIYSIAQMAFSYMVLIPSAMAQLFYVKLGKLYGATKNLDVLNRTVLKYVFILSVVVSFFVVFAYFFLEPIVSLIMPRYLAGVKAAQIILIGLAIYASTLISGNILVIIKKNVALIRSSLYLCFLNAACSIGLVLINGPTIENVAWGTTLSYLIRTIILFCQLKYYANTDIKQMAQLSLIPILMMNGCSVIVFKLIKSRLIGFFVATMLMCLFLILIYGKKIYFVLR